MAKDLLKLFGDKIKEIRITKKLSQEELAEISGLHRTYIGMVERGERNISLKNIEKLSNAFGMNIYNIFKDIK